MSSFAPIMTPIDEKQEWVPRSPYRYQRQHQPVMHASASSSPYRMSPSRWRSSRTAIALAALFLLGLWHIRTTHVINELSPKNPSHMNPDIRKTGSSSSHPAAKDALHQGHDEQVPLLASNSKSSLSKLSSSSSSSSSSSTSGKKPIALEAHIMSKCPDARDCLVDLVVPAMSQLDPSHVNFTLSYIGTTTDRDDGVECRHGPEECLGNILQLCAATLYPDPKQYLGFAYCMVKRLEDIPRRALVQECAAEYGIEFAKLNDCASRDDGSYGVGLLRDSVERTKAAGVKLSCTVRLDDRIWCIRDGGEWANCDHGDGPADLVKAVEKLYHKNNR